MCVACVGHMQLRVLGSTTVTNAAALAVGRVGAAGMTVRMLSDHVREEIESEIGKSKVVVFMKGVPEAPMCGFSANVVQILELTGVTDYHAVNVLADDEIREGIKEFSDWPTIPQVFVDKSFIGGRDIVFSMYQSGDLHETLGLEKPPTPEDA